MSTSATITINDEIDFLGTISDLYAHTYENYIKINDEPVIKEVEEHKWLTAGLTALVAVAVVGAIAVAAICTAGAALAVGVVACAAVAGIVAGAVDGLIQYTTTGEVDWSQVIIATSCGAVSGAVAATPLGVGGQMFVNGVIGGTQSALTGGDVVDIVEGFVIGVLCGKLGGSGYVNGWPNQGWVIDRNIFKSLFHPYNTYVREAMQAILTGVKRSAAFNIFYSWFKEYIMDKLEDLYEYITD